MKNKRSYNLRKLTEDEYNNAPEEVRKVYIHVLKKVFMNTREKARILEAYPEYFTPAPPVTFAQRMQKIHQLQAKQKSYAKAIAKKLRRTAGAVPGDESRK